MYAARFFDLKKEEMSTRMVKMESKGGRKRKKKTNDEDDISFDTEEKTQLEVHRNNLDGFTHL